MQGLVAFTYDEQAASKMEERERQLGLHGEGVLNGFLEVKAISLDHACHLILTNLKSMHLCTLKLNHR